MQRQYSKPADSALDALAAADPAPVALLHAGRFDPRWADRSLLGQPRAWFRCTRRHGSTLDWPDHAGPSPLPENARTHKPWRDLRTLLHATAGAGRWVGYFSYDLAYQLEPHKLGPAHRAADDAWPLIELGFCPTMNEHAPPTEPAGEASTAPPGRASVAPLLERDAYEAAIARVIDYIGAGDAFQVNLAQPFLGRFPGDPRALFQRLATVSPAWYGAYLELGGRDAATGRPRRALLSTSPELFLEVRGRDVVTRPIKGTRSATPGDVRQRDQLLHSEKDTAELNMIVDLLRNDLGRVCDYGSVKVVQPRTIETHPTVHHGVATIAGRLHPSKDIVDLLRAALPGGSITGAPKVRAMQIIDELEPRPRGPYCGAIGWITHDAACLNLAIRTMVLRASDEEDAPTHKAAPHPGAAPHRPRPATPAQNAPTQHPARPDAGTSDAMPIPAYDVSFHVGGGIVADSDPAAEYDETLDKARAMLQALGQTDAPGVTRP